MGLKVVMTEAQRTVGLSVVMTEYEWAVVMAALNAVQIFTDPDGEMHAQVCATHTEIDRQVKAQIILDSAMKGDHA